MKKTIAAVALTFAFSVSAQEEATSKYDHVIVSGAGVTVTEAELDAALENLPPEYQSYASGPGKRAFAGDFLRMKLLAKEAETEKLDQQQDVQTQLQLMRAHTLANAKIARMNDAVEVTDQAVRQAYESRKAEFERVSARHILIAFQGSPAAGEGAPSEEEAKAKAEQIRAELIAGAAFAELAAEHSVDRQSAARGGELGAFGRGQMVPTFEAAVFAGKKGELLPVVRTQFGYHVIEVTDRSVVPFEAIREELEAEARQSAVEAQIERLEKAANPSFDETYFARASDNGDGEQGEGR